MEGRFDIHADNKIASPELKLPNAFEEFWKELKTAGCESISNYKERG